MTHKDWVARDKYAQLIGLLAHEFGYTLESIGQLSFEQINYLCGWLEWYYQRRH